jgi:Asp-tRNA(Asn)/Glu-tRNA(Gln) amidotransferase A subunit family amidase
MYRCKSLFSVNPENWSGGLVLVARNVQDGKLFRMAAAVERLFAA